MPGKQACNLGLEGKLAYSKEPEPERHSILPALVQGSILPEQALVPDSKVLELQLQLEQVLGNMVLEQALVQGSKALEPQLQLEQVPGNMVLEQALVQGSKALAPKL